MAEEKAEEKNVSNEDIIEMARKIEKDIGDLAGMIREEMILRKVGERYGLSPV